MERETLLERRGCDHVWPGARVGGMFTMPHKVVRVKPRYVLLWWNREANGWEVVNGAVFGSARDAVGHLETLKVFVRAGQEATHALVAVTEANGSPLPFWVYGTVVQVERCGEDVAGFDKAKWPGGLARIGEILREWFGGVSMLDFQTGEYQ